MKTMDETQVEASTGGGMVTVRMDGRKRVLSVNIDPDVMDDREMLEDMIRGACNQAHKLVELALTKEAGSMVHLVPPGLV